VETPRRGYWANCLYCALGIAAALKTDAEISTRIGGEAEPVRYVVEGGALRATADVDRWCARHALPKGAVLAMPALWAFASDWYGRHLEQPWRKRSLDEVRALFARHGLTGDFWKV
jgi:hypothetical protein